MLSKDLKWHVAHDPEKLHQMVIVVPAEGLRIPCTAQDLHAAGSYRPGDMAAHRFVARRIDEELAKRAKARLFPDRRHEMRNFQAVSSLASPPAPGATERRGD